MSLRLGVLDQSPVPAGSTPRQALAETLALARLADRLGYRRYWVAEHHNTTALAGSAPEVLIARIASVTERIRVGSGGVMLPHYSPLKVAEQFRVLHELFPGRIDLGIGRAPGSDPLTAHALGRMAEAVDRFPDDVVALVGWLTDRLGGTDPLARVRAGPQGPGAPELWMLGSSTFGAALAAEVGMAFSFAHFINPDAGLAALDRYRRGFRPLVGDAPQASVGASVICAETDAEAARLATSIQVWRRLSRQGRGGPIPSVEDAEALLQAWGEERWEAGRGRMILGSPASVREQLVALADRYGVGEVVVVTITHDPAARRRSYELLADAFGL